MQEFSAITFMNEKSIKELVKYLEQEHFAIYELDGTGINDIKTFFKTIINVLPLDPPLSGNVNYDAFVDSVWGGFDTLGRERVALVWTDSENMLYSDYNNFIKISELFYDLEKSLKTTEFGLEKTIIFLVFMIGKGEKFKPFM